jgi:Holliday junction resolvase-like predicted endonuclease
MPPMNRRTWGKAGEDLAAHFLEQSGLKILERNFRFERGEIDLIARVMWLSLSKWQRQ